MSFRRMSACLSNHKDTHSRVVAQRNYQLPHCRSSSALWSKRSHRTFVSSSKGRKWFHCSRRRWLHTTETFRHDALYRLPNQPLDRFHRQLVNRSDNRDGFALLTCSARTAYAMHVVFGNSRPVIIDYV